MATSTLSPTGPQLDPGTTSAFGSNPLGVGVVPANPPDDFRADVVRALLAHHVDIQTIRVDELDKLVGNLWQNPYVQDTYTSLNGDATLGLSQIDSQLAGAIGGQLFSPSTATDRTLLNQGLNLLTSQNRSLTADQQVALLQGTGKNSDVVSIIIDEAQKAGVDPALALAMAQQESGLNPNAVGDQGHSVGLFQLHDQGMGAGMGNDRYDPRINAQKALQSLAQTIRDNPGIADVGQLAAMSQRPADPNLYAQSINALYGPIKAGKVPTPTYDRKTADDALVAQLASKYPRAESAYVNYFGQKPDYATMAAIIAHDQTTRSAEDYVRSFGSHIPGMNIGQYSDARKLVDSETTRLFGHQGTDDMVKELFDRGMGDPGGTKLFFSELANMKPANFDTGLYNQLFAANTPHYQNYLNETGANPKDLMAQYDQAKASGITVTPTDSSAQAGAAPVDPNNAPAPSDDQVTP